MSTTYNLPVTLVPNPNAADGRSVSVGAPDFTSDLIAINDTDIEYFAAHGLGTVPRTVRAVWVVVNAVGNYSVNDEISAIAAWDTFDEVTMAVSADATIVNLAFPVAGTSNYQIPDQRCPKTHRPTTVYTA